MKDRSTWVNVVCGIVVYCIVAAGSAAAQDKDKPKEPPAEVTIKAEDTKEFRAAIDVADKTNLQIRALAAEIQLAQRQLDDLKAKLQKEQTSLQDQIVALATKGGIPRDKLQDYELQSQDDGSLILKKKAAAPPSPAKE